MVAPRTLLTAWNFYPKKTLGQNFLKDPSVAQMIVARSRLTPLDIVLEIGSGLGALTVPIARTAKIVYAIEKDRRIVPLLKNELLANGIDNVELIDKDFFTVDIEKLLMGKTDKIVVMGNLPYNISSQILIKLIQARNSVSRVIIMVQKELAQRLTASPGCKDYSRLSVVLQFCATIKRVASVKANLFFPQPKVDSEVIEITFMNDYHVHDEAFLFAVIKAAFGMRRKTLRNALAGSELPIDALASEEALQNARIDVSRRAETLNVDEFIMLSNAIQNLIEA